MENNILVASAAFRRQRLTNLSNQHRHRRDYLLRISLLLEYEHPKLKLKGIILLNLFLKFTSNSLQSNITVLEIFLQKYFQVFLRPVFH